MEGLQSFLYFFFLFVLFHSFSSCSKNQKVLATDPDLIPQNEELYFKNELFQGIVITQIFGTNVRRETQYKNGLVHGEELEFYEDGKLASKRFYEFGKRVGLHEGYYEDGTIRFQFSYEDGLMHGEAKDFFPSGKPYTYTIYEKGTEKLIKRWREDGQIYLNLVIKEGIAYGLQGGKLCRQVRSDKQGKTVVF